MKNTDIKTNSQPKSKNSCSYCETGTPHFHYIKTVKLVFLKYLCTQHKTPSQNFNELVQRDCLHVDEISLSEGEMIYYWRWRIPPYLSGKGFLYD
jgi:hypothetical protein